MSFEAEHAEKGERGRLETTSHDINHHVAPTSRDDGHESEITQYSSESSDSSQRIEASTAQVVEPEKQRRWSTRSIRGSKVN